MKKDQKLDIAFKLEEENKEELSALEASQSVVATFKVDGNSQSIKIDGRGPSVLGNIQGDHVTAYALVKRGFARTLQDLELNSEESLADLKERRGKIYEFISAIAVLDEGRRDSLYEGITQILRSYNQQRFKKSEIESIEKYANEKIEEQQKLEEGEKDVKDLIIEHMKKEKLANGQIICSSLESVAETLMTFYNKVPKSAFLQIEGFEAPANEGPRATGALNFLEKTKEIEENRISEQESSLKKELELKVGRTSLKRSENLRKKLEEQLRKDIQESKETIKSDLFSEVIERISDLFFYPEIDQNLLKAHEKETVNLKVSTATPRNNSKEDLILAAAKHMNIVFAAYPELAEKYDQTQLTSAFVAHVISQPYEVKNQKNKRNNLTKKCGWPSFNDEKLIEEISAAVINELQNLQQNTKQNLYSETEGFRSVQSSQQNSARESNELATKEYEDTEESSRIVNSKNFQREVIGKISDEDFIAEMARRMGTRASPQIVQAFQREVNDNKFLDKDDLVEVFSNIRSETAEAGVTYNKQNFDKVIYGEMRSISGLAILKSENFLQNINPHDENHYPEIAQLIAENIQNLETVTVRDLKSIISEQYQKDHTTQEQKTKEYGEFYK